MHHRLNFVTGVVMLVVAGSLAFVVTQSDRADSGTPAGASPPRTSSSRQRVDADGPRLSRLPAGEPSGIQPAAEAHGAAREAPGPVRPGTRATAVLRRDLRVEVDAAHPHRGELEQRAMLVESFALRRLGVLTEQLDLTAEQQARIFPILVRGSQSYDPVMRIVSGSHSRPLPSDGEATASAPLDKPRQHELVEKQLDPAQSEELVERAIRDQLMWEEIIGGLTRQLDQVAPGDVADPEPEPERGMTAVPGPADPAEEVPAAGPDPAAPPESHGGRNLFEQLDPDQ